MKPSPRPTVLYEVPTMSWRTATLHNVGDGDTPGALVGGASKTTKFKYIVVLAAAAGKANTCSPVVVCPCAGGAGIWIGFEVAPCGYTTALDMAVPSLIASGHLQSVVAGDREAVDDNGDGCSVVG